MVWDTRSKRKRKEVRDMNEMLTKALTSKKSRSAKTLKELALSTNAESLVWG